MSKVDPYLKELSPTKASPNKRTSEVSEMRELSPTAVAKAGNELRTQELKQRQSMATSSDYTNLSSPPVIFHQPTRYSPVPRDVDEAKAPYAEPMPDILDLKRTPVVEKDQWRELEDQPPARAQNNTPRPLYALVDDEKEEDFYAVANPSAEYPRADSSYSKTPKYFYTMDEHGGRTYYVESDEDEEEDEEEPLKPQLYKNHVKQRASLYKVDNLEKGSKAAPRPLHPLVEDDGEEFYSAVEIPHELLQKRTSTGSTPKIFYTFEDDGTRSYYLENVEDEEDDEEPLPVEVFKKHIKQRTSLYKLPMKKSARPSLKPAPLTVDVEHRDSRYMGEVLLSEPSPLHGAMSSYPVETRAGDTAVLPKRYSVASGLTEDKIPQPRTSLYTPATDVNSVAGRSMPKRQSAAPSHATATEESAQAEFLRRQSEYMAGLREEQLQFQRKSMQGRETDLVSAGGHVIPKRQSTYSRPTEAEQEAAEMEHLRRQSEYLTQLREAQVELQRNSIEGKEADINSIDPRSIPKRQSTYPEPTEAEQFAAEMERLRRQSEYMANSERVPQPKQRDSIISYAADAKSIPGHVIPKRQSTYTQPTEAEQFAAEMEHLRRQSEYMTELREAQLQFQRNSIEGKEADINSIDPRSIPKRQSTYPEPTEAEQFAAEMERLRRQSEYMANSERVPQPKQRDSIISYAADARSIPGHQVPKRASTYFPPMTAEQEAAEAEHLRRKSRYMAEKDRTAPQPYLSQPESAEAEHLRRQSEYLTEKERRALNPYYSQPESAEAENLRRRSEYMAAKDRGVPDPYYSQPESAETQQLRRQSEYMAEKERRALERYYNQPESAETENYRRQSEYMAEKERRALELYYSQPESAEAENLRRRSEYMAAKDRGVPDPYYSQPESAETDLRRQQEADVYRRYSVRPERDGLSIEAMEAFDMRRNTRYLGGKDRNESGRMHTQVSPRHGSIMEEADKAAVPVVMTVQPRQIDKRPPLLFLIEEEATGTVDYDRRQSRALGPVPDANEEARHYAEHRPQVVPYFQSEDMPPTDWDDVTYYRDTQTDDFTQTPQPIPAKKSGKRKKTKAPGSRYPPLPHSSRGVTPRETASQRTPPKDNYWSFVTPSNNTTKKTSARYASSGRAPERSTTPYTSGTHLAKMPSRSATPLGRYTDSPYLQNYPRRQITSAPPARTGGYDERPTQFSNTFTAGAAPSRTRYDLNSGDRVSSHYINGSYRYCDLQTGKMMQHRPGGYVDEELAGYNDARMQRLSDRRQY